MHTNDELNVEAAVTPHTRLKPHSLPTFTYSIAEACAISGVRRTSLYKAIRLNKLRAVKAGRRTLILADDLSRWLHLLPAKTTLTRNK
jgi:excisionase family DNA binding protein